MKAAITAAVTTFAQTAGAWSDRDTATIEQLRRELHDVRNRATIAEGTLEMVAIQLDLTGPPTPAGIVAAIRKLQDVTTEAP